jgi:molybdopterin synthase sulfur carrier subunit
MKPEIEVLYFAVFQDFTRKSHETLTLKSPMTPRTLYQELSQKYSFPLSVHQLRFAINHRFISEDTPIQSGDTVAFIPPVSGG